LYVVSTPIGNLEDMSPRAVRVLKEVDVVAAEDTRHTKTLFAHFGIATRLVSYHDHNERSASQYLGRLLAEGKSVAIVSDAGTPGLSDPGYDAVSEAIRISAPVVSVPGPSAVTAALSISGLPTDRFVFEGFLPVKKGRKTRLSALALESRTLVFFEGPHRLVRTLNDLAEALGERRIAVCRELTKQFEEVRRGTIPEMIDVFSAGAIRGEFVLVVEGNRKAHEKPFAAVP
jgi:16S rRNA (cytidine1402-2'-O)-methyltransferase